MPFDPSVVGAELGHVRAVCDARWLMSYAAGVPDERPELYDTEAGLVVHPVFAVAPEWELLTLGNAATATLTSAERRRGVHAGHDLLIERPVREGDVLDVTGRVVGVDRTRAGTVERVLMTATDAGGAVVWRTLMTSMFRGVELVGEPVGEDLDWPGPPPAAPDGGTPVASIVSPVRVADAHAYTECARIWNPIHTDVKVAHAAGLHAPILHGTATMARAVSAATAAAGRSLADVRRVCARFTGMVDLGTAITIDVTSATDAGAHVTVRNHTGAVALADGWVGY